MNALVVICVCVFIVLLQSSYGAPKQNGSNNDSLPNNPTATLTTISSSSEATSPPSVKGNTTTSPDTAAPAGSTQTACQKKLVNITVGAPRKGCSPGLMVAVPVCSGACNSYVQYLKTDLTKSHNAPAVELPRIVPQKELLLSSAVVQQKLYRISLRLQ